MKSLEYLYRMLKANQEMGNTPENILECIAELGALQQPKSCEGCKYSYEYKTNCLDCNLLSYANDEGCESFIDVENTFYCNKYELKEQQ